MRSDVVGLAFAAGLVAALNPCGFAMLPAYLALVVRGEGSSRPSAVGRALTATAAMALGFIAVFGAFGLLTTSAANTLQAHLPYVTLAVGIALAVVGVWSLAGRELPVPARNFLGGNTQWAPTARLGSMFGYGLGYALASLSCTIGPFLAVTGIGVSGSSGGGLSAFLSYAAGFTLIVGTLAVASALASSALVDRMRQVLPYVSRISGGIVLLVGAYVGYYGWYELQLRSTTADPRDPVIAVAARLQGTLAGWVFAHGPWPWLSALTAMVLAALAWTHWRQRARRYRTERRR
jgi:cytochrome c biogenesis protein CcdA